MKEFIYRKGDVFLADLGIPHGSEQDGRRPVVIIKTMTAVYILQLSRWCR
jgi:mRNA-degrading endonuclease toxin of MazEF toxin-antitoxin module